MGNAVGSNDDSPAAKLEGLVNNDQLENDHLRHDERSMKQ